MKKGRIILISVIVLALIALIVSMRGVRKFDWTPYRDPTIAGTEPYDFALFDTFLTRSLDNGYYKRVADTVRASEKSTKIFGNAKYSRVPEIADMPADTSLMVIDTHTWVVKNDTAGNWGYDAQPIYDLIEHARRGGKSLYVLNLAYHDFDLEHILDLYFGEDNIRIVTVHDVYGYRDDPMGPQWLTEKPDKEIPIREDNQIITIHSRYAYKYLEVDGYKVNTYLHNAKRQDVSIDYEDYDGKYYGGHYGDYYLDYDRRNPNYRYAREVEIRTYLYPYYNREDCYLLDIRFPEKDGHLYITPLSLYFTNLGLMVPDGPQVIEYIMGKIDDRPVVQVTYPYKVANKQNSAKENNQSVLAKNKPLSLTVLLLFAFAVALLARGLMRRYPVSSHADEPESTDMVALRGVQFRKSPLLHFLYQCSWMYQGSNNYTDLFKSNFRRLARTVRRVTGIELRRATDEQLRQAARTFATMQGRNAEEIYQELKWMQDSNLLDNIEANAKQFRYSQKVVEKYPFK